jgi:hypothetical protein
MKMAPLSHKTTPVPQAIQKTKSINNIVMGIRRPIKNDLIWLLVDAIPVFGDKINSFM